MVNLFRRKVVKGIELSTLGTNETGFTALPGGIRSDGTFMGIGERGNFWSFNISYVGFGLFYPIPYTESFPRTPMSGIQYETNGLAVRCIKYLARKLSLRRRI